ncbi:MAG TPA: LamG-like jellyroll fold domain-containing protein [Azospirillum sp.]
MNTTSDADYGLDVRYSDGCLRATWSADWIPAGCTARLTITDGSGLPVPGLSVDYGMDGTSAVVAGAAVVPGATFRVSVYAAFPASPPDTLTVMDLAAPPAPALSNRSGGIVAAWTAVEGAEGYALRVLDADGAPLPAQPPIAGGYGGNATAAWVDGAGLPDGALYGVQVRATAGRSSGAWSPAATVQLDRSHPDSALLHALLDRLRAAGPAFTLDDSIVQAADVTDLFAPLLGLPSGIPLTGAATAWDYSSVTLTGRVAFFGVPDVSASFVFTAPEESLHLTLTGSLGPMTVLDLYGAGILPGTLYPPAAWAADLAGFADVDMTLVSIGRAIRFGGQPAASPWSVLSIAGATLAAPVPAIVVVSPPAPEMTVWVPRFATTLTMNGVTVPVYLEVPAGASGWRIGLDAPDGFNLGSLSTVAPLLAGDDDNSNLPDSLIDLGQFWLDELSIGFTPADTQLWRVSAGLSIGRPDSGADPVWTIVDGVLSLDAIRTDLLWTLMVPPDAALPSASARGEFHGRISVLGQPVDAIVPVPPGAEGWTLRSAANIDLTGLGQLGVYFGGDADYLTDLLAPLGSLQTFALSDLSFRFHPPPAGSIDEITVGLTVERWTIPAIPWFSVERVHLAADVVNPAVPATRAGTVRASMVFSIGDCAWLAMDGLYSSADELLEMATTGGCVDLVTVGDLSRIVTPQQVADNVPPDLPTGGLFSVGELAFVYDAARAYLPLLGLSLETTVPWVIVEDLLVLDGFSIDLGFETPGPGQPTVGTGTILAPIVLADVPVLLRADKPSGGDPWRFGAEVSQTRIDFAALVAQFLGAGTVLPAGYGFPAAMTIQSLEATLVPSLGSFRLTGDAFLDWTIPFGDAVFSVTGLQGDLDIPGGAAPSTGWIGGTFAFEPMRGAATLMLGGLDTPTVVSVVVTNAAAIAPRSQVDQMCGAGTWESVPAPADFTDPSFFRAGVVLNLTENSYLVHGAYGATDHGLYGAVVLLVGRRADGPWGFALSAALADWSFARISAPLAVVDSVLSVKKAGAAVSLSSLDGDAGPQIARFIPAIGQDFAVTEGLNVFAVLDFTGGLMPEVAFLLGITAQGPFTVQGFIPADASTARFTATLGNLTLLGALSFDGLVLTYTVSDASVLTLTGTIGLSVPALGGPDALSFAGSMVVDAVAARFRVDRTDQAIDDPLGIPGVVMTALGFGLEYVFETKTDAGATVPAVWRMRLQGSVAFPGAVALTGKVLFTNGTPVVSVVEITQPLSVDAVFQQMIGSAWPTGLLDIVFQKGAIWYAPAAVTADGTAYAQGFNARATTTVYTLADIVLSAQLTADSAAGPGGMVASAQSPAPIDWGFVSFYDPKDGTLGPAVAIDSGRDLFQVRCGIALFDSPAAECTLTVTDTTMYGTLTVPGGMGPFDNPTLSFTWDDRNGFQVADWPLKGLQLPEFSFDRIQGSGNCRQTVIDSLPIDSRFDVDASLGITLKNGVPSLKIVLNGTFDLVVKSSAYPKTLLSADVVNTALVVPFPGTGRFTWDDLADSFIDCMQDAADSIFRNLLEDPANLAKLLGGKAIEFAVGEVAAYLICRNIPQATAQAFATGATGAIATAVEIGGTSILVGGVVGTLIGGVFTNGGGTAAAASGTGDPAPGTPGAPLLSWSDGLAVTWSAVADADRYSVAYGTDPSTPSAFGPVSGTSATVPAAAGPTYYARLVASGPGGVSAPGPLASIQTFDAPTGVVATFDDPRLTVRWNPVTMVPGLVYQVSVSQNGQPVPADAWPIGTCACAVTSDLFEKGGTFAVTVTAISPQMANESSSVAVTIGVLSPAYDPRLSYGPGTVLVTWASATGATGYVVQVVDDGGAPVSPQPAVTFGPSAWNATLAGGTLANGQTVRVRVKATAPGMVGDWGPTVSGTIDWLPAPADVGLILDENNRILYVGYSPVPGATYYDIDVLDSTGASVSSFPQSVMTQIPAGVGASSLAYGSRYGVRVRARTSLTTGAWSAPLDITPTALEAPEILSIVRHLDRVTVSFTPVSSATSYMVELSTSTSPYLIPPLDVVGTGSPIDVPVKRLSSGNVYSVKVLAVHADTSGFEPASSWNPAPGTAVSQSPCKQAHTFTWNPYQLTGNCLSLRSAGDSMRVFAPQYDMIGTGNLSIQVTVRVPNVAALGVGILIDRMEGDWSGKQAGFHLRLDQTGYLIFYMSDGRGNVLEAIWTVPPDLFDGNWHDIAIVRQNYTNEAAVQAYIDGNGSQPLARNRAAIDITTSNDLTFGIWAPSGPVCDLTAVRLWTRALTQSEIGGMRFGPPKDRSHLVGEWTFDSGRGDDTSSYSSLPFALYGNLVIVPR